MGSWRVSTRREIPLFSPIETRRNGNKKPTGFLRRFKTEGIVFKLNPGRISEWLISNGIISGDFTKGMNPSLALRTLVQSNEYIEREVYKLLHTFSHLLIQQSSIDTGLDSQSLSEIVYPALFSILIYSTSNINTGGIEYTFDNHMPDWLHRIDELAKDCSQDPACMEDEGGACNACLFVPQYLYAVISIKT